MLNVVLVGSIQAGKSQVLNRLLGKGFSSSHVQTAIDIAILNNIRFYELGGSELYAAIRPDYYRSADVFLVFCDLIDERSLTIDIEKSFTKDKISQENPEARFILVANKLDLTNKQKITPAQLQAFATRHGFAECYSVSAKTNEGIEALKARLTQLATEKEAAHNISLQANASPSSETTRQNPLLEELNRYIAHRERNRRAYYHWFSSIFGGFDRNSKLTAAYALSATLQGIPGTLEILTPKQKRALNQGNLGNIYHRYLNQTPDAVTRPAFHSPFS